jgi:exo-beta-1,3-glucanase (GH17 family)
MNYTKELHILKGKAVCYSGFRNGQSPDLGIFPSYNEIKEDLFIIKDHWDYIRMYDCDTQAETVLQIIREEKLPIKVLLGAYIHAEKNNFGCPWGGVYPEETLEKNKKINLIQIKKLIAWANKYNDVVFALSAGNEATVDWSGNFVPVNQVIDYVKMIKEGAKQPVTFCENYAPWSNKLEPLVKELDFISIHTYPVWEYKNIHEAIEYTKENYNSIANKYPNKLVVITEAGWATNSNGRGIDQQNVSEENQKIYYNDLMDWSEKDEILTFVFEAFDEPWKGSDEPLEPEKHWGMFYVDRTPKLVMKEHFSELS